MTPYALIGVITVAVLFPYILAAAVSGYNARRNRPGD
jgi:hypothetical protein